MKTIIRQFLLVTAACLLNACNVEQPMKWQKTGQVEFDLLVVQMPEAEAIPLIAELRDRKRSSMAAEKVVKLIGEKRATLVGWPILTTKSGMRAVVEEIHEFRYATGFETPAAPMPVQGPAADVAPSIDGQVPPPVPEPVDISLPASTAAGMVDGESQAFEALPTTFETRNLGITLEIEPIVSTDGRTIDLSLVPQHVCLLGMRKTEVELKSSRKKVVVEQPEIMSIRLTTSLQVKDGEHTLLGVFKISNPPDHMEFLILHTQLKRIEVPVGRAKTILSPGDPSPPNSFVGPGTGP